MDQYPYRGAILLIRLGLLSATRLRASARPAAPGGAARWREGGRQKTEPVVLAHEDTGGAVALDTPSLGGFYHVKNTPETFTKLTPVFQTAFEKWQSSLKAKK